MSDDLVCVSTVARERVKWLWKGRIPLGKVTVLDGDPGMGKSTLTLTIAAKVTTGSPFPDGDRPEPADVILLSAEDEIADTIRPRLEAAGADLDRCWVLPDVRPEGEPPRPPEFPLDLSLIEDLVKDRAAGLVVVDPIAAFLSGAVDMHRDQDVRRVLASMAYMAARTAAAVLIVRHMNKSGGGNPLYRGGGSIGIVGAARAGLLAAPDPDDQGRRVLAVSKTNLAALPGSLAYRLVEDERYGVVRVTWDGDSEHTAADLVGVPLARPAPKQDEGEAFLRQQLKGGARQAADLRDLAQARGLSWRTVQRAMEALEVEVERRPEPGKRGRGPSWWALPNTRPEIRAATENTQDGAYSDEVKPQVSEPDEAGIGIGATAPSLLEVDPDPLLLQQRSATLGECFQDLSDMAHEVRGAILGEERGWPEEAERLREMAGRVLDRLHANEAELRELHKPHLRSWERTEGRGKRGVGLAVITVTHNPGGWRVASNASGYPGLEICNSIFDTGPPRCPNLIVFKVERLRRNTIGTSYWCDEHLPTEHRPKEDP